jgi:hypothetical protein
LDSRREETTSQVAEVDPKKHAVTIQELAKITDKQIAKLDAEIAKYSIPEGNPEWLEQPLPFREREFHYFMTELLMIRRNVLQLRSTTFLFIDAIFQHTLEHIHESEEKAKETAGAAGRIGAGEFLLEILEKLPDEPAFGMNQGKHGKHDHNEAN